MTLRISSPEQLAALPEKGIEAQKIRALLAAYGTGYDFCRFYLHNKNSFLAEMGGSFVLCAGNNADGEELAQFLDFNGCAELLCADDVGGKIISCLGAELSPVNVMRFEGEGVPCEMECSPLLSDVYGIVGGVFGFEFEPWYLDMSHRVRHGVARCRKLEGSALVIQHEINGEALISQVATLPEQRGRGLSSRLLLSVCAELAGNDIFVICEDELISFYKKNGFEVCGRLAQIARK